MNSTVPSAADIARLRRRRETLRWSVRALFLAASLATVLPALDAWPAATSLATVSPLVTLASLLSTRTVSWSLAVGLAVVLLAAWRLRWFCRWACPTGCCTDVAGQLGARLRRRCPRRLPPLGSGLAMAALAGAALGIPLLLWLDPLALLASFLTAWRQDGPARWWLAAGLLVVVVLSLFWPGAWCGRLCPLGGLQDLCWRAARMRRRAGEGAATTRGHRWRLSRRAALGGALGVAGALLACGTVGAAPPALRPPGARKEETFTALCVRCGHCVEACPSGVLRPDLGEHGLAGLLAPTLSFAADYCREDCARCGEACPSGAIAPLELAAKRHAVIGVPHVDADLCLLTDERECGYCRSHCPYGAVALIFSEEEYTLQPRIDLARCNGCGACEAACPTRPVRAIVIRPHRTRHAPS